MTEVRNPKLMDAVRAYVQAAIAAVAAQGRPQGHLLSNERWARQGKRAYVRQTDNHVLWLGFHTQVERIHGLPEYAVAIGLLQVDPVISPQLGKLVGTAFGATGIYGDQILDNIAAGSVRDDDFIFDEDKFTDAYIREEATLYTRNVTLVALAPVAGLLESPTIHFGSLELDRMTEEEATVLLGAGLLQSTFGTFGGHVQVNSEYVLRMRYELPKIVRDNPSDATTDPFAGVPRVAEECLDVLLAMRLLKASRVGVSGVITFHHVRGGRATSWGPLGAALLVCMPEYRLDETEARDLGVLWRQLKTKAVQKRKFLGTAVRRFSYAGERTRVEDRFVDLMIAAEAMFLGEKVKGETTGELAYKISTRFAYFTTLPGTTKRERFNFMKVAYTARSSIVHGGRVKGLNTSAKLEQFTSRMAEHLRIALRTMITEAEAHPGRKVLVDWDELILGP